MYIFKCYPKLETKGKTKKKKRKKETRVGFETSKAFFIRTYVTVSKIYISPLSIYSTNGLDLENTIQIHFGSHANDMTVCLIFV